MIISDPVASLQLTPNEVRFYREEGYLYIPSVVSREDAAEIAKNAIEVVLASGKTLDDLRLASGQKGSLLQSHQYLGGSALDDYVNSPSLNSIAAQLMEGPSTLYMPFTAIKSGGGGGTFNFHQDNQYTRFDGPGINLWMALSPMSPENGCLMVVPRSHLSGTEESILKDGHRAVATDPTRFLPIRMNPGDVIAFSRLTIHGSGPNHTSEPRLAYAVQFHRDDVKAVWDGEEPRLLKENPRWSTGPVEELTSPDAKGRDGH